MPRWSNPPFAPELKAFLATRHTQATVLYLLLDPLADCPDGHLLHLESVRHTLGDQAITPVLRPDLSHSPHRCPALVRVAEPAFAELLTAVVDFVAKERERSKRYVCGFIASGETAEGLAQDVVALGRTGDARQQQYFPVHEPPRLALLAAYPSPAVHRAWGAGRHWLFPAASGGYAEFSSADGTSEHATAVQQDAPLIALLLKLWYRLRQRPQIAASWRQPRGPLPSGALMAAYEQIQNARRLGLQERDDVVVYALFRLLVHPRLHEHARVRASIAQSLTQGLPLGNTLGRFDNQILHDIVHDLYRRGSMPC
jgi:hypothetical protein